VFNIELEGLYIYVNPYAYMCIYICTITVRGNSYVLLIITTVEVKAIVHASSSLDSAARAFDERSLVQLCTERSRTSIAGVHIHSSARLALATQHSRISSRITVASLFPMDWSTIPAVLQQLNVFMRKDHLDGHQRIDNRQRLKHRSASSH
jgi:hypothetical protein